MADYMLAVGGHTPYGFSARDADAASRHAAEYLVERHWTEFTQEPAAAITLAGPDGLLTRSGEGLRAFCERINPPLTASGTDDVRPADPTTPDCNTG